MQYSLTVFPMSRLVTPLAFALAAALVAAAAMLVFGDPAKESRNFLAILVLAPACAAAVTSALVSGAAGAYRMGFARGALVGLASLLVFSTTMAVLGCPVGSWFDCLLKSLVIFGFVMGVPVVVLSALVGLLLQELFAA